MFDNEDTPTTPRPSFPKEAPEPEIQLANSTSPSTATTEAATQNTQESVETAEEAISLASASHNTSSTEESTPEEAAAPELPINTTKESTPEETAAPELPINTTEESTPEEAAAPEPQQNEPATSLEETETAVDASEDKHSGTPPIQEESSDPPSPTIQVPRIQSEPLAVPTPSPTPVRPYVSVEDLLELRIASDPQISPNGTLIAFTVQQCHSHSNKTSSAIWLARNSADKNTSPWQISNGEAHDTTSRWSPDGNTLAFLSDRTGTSQIYLLSMHGGEAHQLSSLAQGVSEYSWHPGGGTLLAHSAWKSIDDQPNTEPQPDTRVYTRLDGEHDGQGHQQGRHQQLWLIALNGQTTRLTAESVDLVQSCWSPDGTEIAFSANRRKDSDLNPGRAIWILTLRTGQFRHLTDEEGFACCPSWSPDGQYIAYIATADLTEAGNYVPWLVRAQGNEAPRLATQGAEQLTCQSWIIDELHTEWLQPPHWYPDSHALLVPVQEHGQIHLYKLDIIQQIHTRLTNNNGCYRAPQLSRNGQTIATIRADWFTPGDLWSMDGTGQNPHRRSGINDAFLQTHQLLRPRRIAWQSFDGAEIEGWLYMPPLPSGARAPLIIAPHGGPALAWGDSYNHEFQVLAGRGYAVLAPNIRGSAGYGETFSRKTLNDWGGTDFRDLLLGIDHVSRTEPIDGERLGIGGMSYGGYLTCWAISQTTRFKAAVSRNGISSLVTASLFSDQRASLLQSMHDPTLQHERSPLTFAEQMRTPLLLLHAEDDLSCPFTEAQQLFITLRQRKQLVVLVSYPHTSHLMDWPTVGTPQQRLDRLRRTVAWFERLV